LLEEIIREIEKEPGPLTVKELARRLGIEQSALEGMLEFLERKGRLSVYRPDECEECGLVSCAACVYGRSCPVKEDKKGRRETSRGDEKDRGA
jgi:predicted Zn-ribbon and HTH transcriptional regulator